MTTTTCLRCGDVLQDTGQFAAPCKCGDAEYHVQQPPAWHERPTESGLWLLDLPAYEAHPLRRLDQEDIDDGAPYGGQLVYGPIPELPQEKQP